MRKLSVYLFLGFSAFACASTPPEVKNKSDGTFALTRSAQTNRDARLAALNDAQEHCANMSKAYSFIAGDSVKTRTTAKETSDDVGFLGRKATRKVSQGAIGGLGSAQSLINNSSRALGERGYEVHFRCD